MPPPRLPEIGRNLVNQRGSASGANTENALPKMIKCYVCKKPKNSTEYANVQLRRYQDTLYNPYAPRGRSSKDPKTTCKACTPGQTKNLTCRICHKTKDLEDFAKQQRSHPEKARCIKCVSLHLDTEPDITPPSSDYYETDEEGDFDAPQGTNTKVKAKIARVIMPKGQNFDSDDDDDAFYDEDGEGWKDVDVAGKSKRQQNVYKFRPPVNSIVPSVVGGGYGGGYGGSQAGQSQITGKPSESQAVTKSNYSAVIPKGSTAIVPKPAAKIGPTVKKANKWGATPAEEVPSDWATYSREIRGRRGEPTLKKKVDDSDDDDDEVW